MANSSLLSPLNAVLDQSFSLLSLAREQNWEVFEVLLQQRQAGMKVLAEKDYLEALTKAELDTDAKELIRQIQELNQQLSELASKKRDQVVAEIRQLTIADKVAGAYGQ